jgi:hypothetical protein
MSKHCVGKVCFGPVKEARREPGEEGEAKESWEGSAARPGKIGGARFDYPTPINFETIK